MKKAVFYTYSGHYEWLVAVSIQSIIDHYISEEVLDILVFTDKTFDYQQSTIRQLPILNGKPQIKISFWRFPKWINQINNNISERFPAVTFLRLGIPIEFQEFDTMLYLDADTLIYTDIHEVFDQIENATVAGVLDIFHYLNSSDKDALQHYNKIYKISDSSKYINSGVILFNNKRYAMNWTIFDLVNDINNGHFVSFPDQELINKKFNPNILILAHEYNYQENVKFLDHWDVPESYKKTLIEAAYHIKIKHFLPVPKPSNLLVGYRDQYDIDWWEKAMELKKILPD
ncbi:glycosyltransferase [Leuconostoc fallax]|uniref:Glycosyl transferase family 8 C-terminal domain-containing protein n=1 Tax=Leuconostoc fallax TaxID=1251 RepID=A0A4R5N6P7_9LACO|nr:glycosyltransferase [Leuconostoc fallax]MBU7456371.1 glycosyl transferase [Leuconostoc fallax]TDG67246.1 hypothetical protein C5L23_000200 [Leuconostoc fallax]